MHSSLLLQQMLPVHRVGLIHSPSEGIKGLRQGEWSDICVILSAAERETFVHSCFVSSTRQASACEKGFFS